MNSFTQIIQIPYNVSVFWRKNQFVFQGPLGILNFCPSKHSKGSTGFRIRLARQENFITDKNPQWELVVENPEKTRQIQAYGNTLISLIRQKILGVSQGFFLTLDIQGIGYRVNIRKGQIFFKLGYSHEIILDSSPHLRIFSPKPNLLCVYSINFHELTQFCETIRRLKKPEPYKGKGIRFQGQTVSLRIGKKK
jgi:large subunit ribosomal protein L6